MKTFDDIYYDFTKTSLWHDMLNTRENTPYHRENSVAEHTRLCLSWFKNNLYNSAEKSTRLLTQLAILFHDVGKPKSQVVKENVERGVYNSYAGHELLSARIFEDYACSNDLGLSTVQIRQVKWMIENHIPYSRSSRTLDAFRVDMTYALNGNLGMFRGLLLSDASGRISDTPKIDKVVSWIEENLYPVERKFELSKKNASILVGASGSGKSSLVDKLKNANSFVFNLDSLRIDYYHRFHERDPHISFGDLYHKAWTYCNDIDVEKAFSTFVQKTFLNNVRKSKDIIIDNTNLSVKTRRQWIALLQNAGYYITGFEFMSSLDLLEKRLEARTDRQMHFKIVKHQYNRTTLLRYGSEVNEIRVIKNV